MAEVEDQEDGQRNVRGQEVRDAPVRREEDGKAVGDGQQGDDEQGVVRSVGLEASFEGEGVEQSSELHGSAEPEVGDQADDPGDETADGRNVAEPVEDHGSAVADVEEGEESESPSGEDCEVGNSLLGGVAEDLGRLTSQGHAVQDTAARVKESIARRPSRSEDGKVDDMVEAADSGILDGDDPGTGRGVAGAGQEPGVGARDDGAEDQGRHTIEDTETPDESLGGLGNVASRGDGLAGSHGDELGASDESEAGLDEGGPVSQESAGGARRHVLVDGSGRVGVPVAEADGIVAWAAAAHENNTENDETSNGDQLDTREPELGFTKDFDGDDVENQNDNQDEGDPEGR